MKVSMRPHKTLPGWYTLDYRPNGAKGKREREHYESYDVAMAQKTILEGGPLQQDTVHPRLADVVDEYLAWCADNLSDSTLDGKRRRLKKHIIPAIGQFRVKDLNQRVLDGYFKGRSKSVRLVDLSHIKALIRWMVQRRYAAPLTWEPEVPKYNPRVKQLPLPEDIIAFVNSLKKPIHREACWLMLQSAVRWGELQHLRWERYREAKPILVEEEGRAYGVWVRMGEILLNKTKTDQDEPITFPITPWWDENRKAEGYIFSVRHGGMMSAINRRLKEHSDRTGIKMTPHMFRHACGTYLYEQTGDIRAVQMQLRHSKLSTTEIYVRKSVVRKRESSKTLVGIFRGGKSGHGH